MPYSYTVHADLNLILLEFHGAMNLREWLRSIDELGTDPQNTERTNIIADFRDITGFTFDETTQRELASLVTGLSLQNTAGKSCALWVHDRPGPAFVDKLVELTRNSSQVDFARCTNLDDALLHVGVNPEHHRDRFAPRQASNGT